MRVRVLHVLDCLGAASLRMRLAEVLADRADVSVDEQLVEDADAAATMGMRGSPTLLIDGVDPFAGAGNPPSLSCRLYLDESGRLSGVPSVAQLRAVLAAASQDDG